MKKIILSFAIIAAGFVNAQANKFDQLFNQLESQKGISTISVNKSMFNFLENLEIDAEAQVILSRVDQVKMIVLDSKSDKDIKAKFSSLVKDMKLEELLVVTDNGDKVSFYTENAKEKSFKNLLMDVSTKGEKVFLFIEGEINADDIKKYVTIVKK